MEKPVMADRKYSFSWELLGDIAKGRPNLGFSMNLEVYRLAQLTIRDVLEQQLGSEKTDKILYQAGELAGCEFCNNHLSARSDFGNFMKSLQEIFRELRIGILRIEEADMDKGVLTLTMSEDLDCSGMPETGFSSCTYDEGFIAGILKNFAGRSFRVKEVECWCTGNRTCRFRAEMIN